MPADQYALHLAQKPGPVTLQHPKTGQDVGSWTYLVSHEQRGLRGYGGLKLKEIFDFSSRQVLTLDPKSNVITKIDGFDDRTADVEQAYNWLTDNHANWYFKLPAPVVR